MKYNILIIGIETCRKDGVQCYNAKRNTPVIQEFANRSLVFDNYYTVVTNTYQSWGCLFSGKYAHNSGIGIKPKEELDINMMHDIFLDNGYYVSVGDFRDKYRIMGPEINYRDSIEEFKEPFLIFIGTHSLVDRNYGLDHQELLRSRKDDIIDAHGKYIERVDKAIKSCIEKYSKYENTVIIVTADHGDRIIDGNAEHIDNIDHNTINVPFILYHPKIKPGRTDILFSNIDVLPTLLGFCGMKCGEKFDGADLSTYLSNIDNLDKSILGRTIQIGPSVGCKEILQMHWKDDKATSTIQNYEYSRKEVLMRYKDYKDREYVNNLFAKLEKENYFKDEWVERSKTYNNLNSQQDKELINNIIDMMDLRSNLNIIDAGAGTGIISMAIAEKIEKERMENIEICAIDQCYSMLEKCPENKNIKKYIADIGHMAFIPDNSIDRIVCRMVLHTEFENVDNIIKEFMRILRNDGILIISEVVPMDDSLLDFYKSFLLNKEKRCVFIKDDLVNIMDMFINVDVKEIILKRQSIKNWLYNSCTEKNIANDIFRSHSQAAMDIKKKISMIEEKEDIFCDWKYAIIKGMKRTDVKGKSIKAEIDTIFELIPGMISKEVAMFLYKIASMCSRAAIVDIGGYYGLSTACLAKGSKSGGNMHVYSVDPCSGLGTTPDPTWMNSEDPGTPDPKYYKDVGTTFFEVRELFRQLEISDVITSIVNYSEPAYKQGWDMPIELLFIDGDNRYNYVKMDLEMWGKHVIRGGIIIMHDQGHPGVKRVIDEMILNNPRYIIKWEPLFHVIVK